MNKYSIFFLLFAVCAFFSTVFGQHNHFRFQKLLAEDAQTPIAVAIENQGAQTLEFLASQKIKLKFATPEWIYVNANPQQLHDFQVAGKIGLFHFEFSMPQALNDSSVVTHRIDLVHDGLGGLPAGYTGKDIIIGYVDQGLDYNHPDFRDANGHTRVLRYWDHTLPFDATRTPQPYNYGQAWDSLDIAQGICTSNELGTGHGTTVTGAGSGNGLANGKNKGVAPDSKIIVVETNFSLPNWTLTVADACDYIFKVADTLGLPAIVNLSVGSYLGSHDGNDAASVLIEALLDEKPGRAVVCAAGNGGNWQKYHVRGFVDADTSFVWMKNNPSGQLGANTIYFDMWATPSEIQNVSYAFGADRPGPNYSFAGSTIFRNANSSLNTPINDTLYNAVGQRLASIQIFTSLSGGAYQMEVLMKVDSVNHLYRFSTTGSGKYDLWTNRPQMNLNELVTTIPTIAQYPPIAHYHMPDSLQSIVSSWNCSEKVVSVGNMHNRMSYLTKAGTMYYAAAGSQTGKLSIGSSKGPSRLDVMKPDITAAGDVSLSAAPYWILNNVGYNTNTEIGGFHARNGGTSMASPVVAGVAALYFEKCNTTTYADFLRDLKNGAKQDNYTGITPNFGYGYGKLDALNTLLYSAEIVSDPFYCNTPMNLTAQAGNVVNSVVWQNGSTANPFIINQPGTYTATVTYNGSCVGMATTEINQGQELPTPLVSLNGNTFSASTSPNYQWNLNGTPIIGANSQEYTATVGGVYTVSTTSSTGCVSTSDPISNLSLNALFTDQLLVLPNPSSQAFTIQGLKSTDQLNIIDMHGRMVPFHRKNISTIDLGTVSTGIYFIHIQRENEVGVIKITRN
jgi:subtilisin family serine protease